MRVILRVYTSLASLLMLNAIAIKLMRRAPLRSALPLSRECPVRRTGGGTMLQCFSSSPVCRFKFDQMSGIQKLAVAHGLLPGQQRRHACQLTEIGGGNSTVRRLR